jgi:polysaccharide pyruvyl transferase WcaK-like protein
MTMRGRSADRHPTMARRVGLFGKLGSGNIGNDASMESMLRYLRADHADAIVDAMCAGPERIQREYKIDAIPISWYSKHSASVSGVLAIALKTLGKGIDALRIARWVRRHDVVIVPGMGVLEASLPVPVLEFPYAMFLLGAAGRLFGTRVALVSVGASEIKQPLTRMLLNSAARLAFYRSYRDDYSREIMGQRGVDISGDRVYADLAFARAVPGYEPAGGQFVAVGVMSHYGSNADRAQAGEIYAAYIDGMKRFVRWLVDSGRSVRLIVGDTNGSDDAALQEILADLRGTRPGCLDSQVAAEPVVTFADLMQQVAQVDSVVAIRFHNVICGLLLAKPTIAISYSPKHDALMADAGLSGFSDSANWLDSDQLIRRFQELERQSAELQVRLEKRTTENAQLVGEQFADLTATLFSPSTTARTAGRHRTSAA